MGHKQEKTTIPSLFNSHKAKLLEAFGNNKMQIDKSTEKTEGNCTSQENKKYNKSKDKQNKKILGLPPYSIFQKLHHHLRIH